MTAAPKAGVARLEEMADWLGDVRSDGETLLSRSVAIEHASDLRALLSAFKARGEALEPFAEVDCEGVEDYADTTAATVIIGRTTSYFLTLGDFRKARTALTQTQGDDQ